VWRRRGRSVIAGVDEVGRGCLAGPVFAAALILPPRVPAGIRDSKELPPGVRERLFDLLRSCGARVNWARVESGEIDRINIRQASFLAMRRAVEGLDPPPEALLVDGFAIPDCPLPQRALPHGDARSLSIAAASIVAKVLRDRFMAAQAHHFPQYGFERHKGYPTREHLRALERHGPCPLHRMSFGPLRRLGAAEDASPVPAVSFGRSRIG
jgi:ribonuclease HII